MIATMTRSLAVLAALIALSAPAAADAATNACERDQECSGPLPHFCRVCSDGVSVCAHWACVNHTCVTQSCPKD
jgi:hypothetical protein